MNGRKSRLNMPSKFTGTKDYRALTFTTCLRKSLF